MNSVSIIGPLKSEPVFESNDRGDLTAFFSVIIPGKISNEIECTAYGGPCEAIEAMLERGEIEAGDTLAVMGGIQSRDVTDADGYTHAAGYVRANRVELVRKQTAADKYPGLRQPSYSRIYFGGSRRY